MLVYLIRLVSTGKKIGVIPKLEWASFGFLTFQVIEFFTVSGFQQFGTLLGATPTKPQESSELLKTLSLLAVETNTLQGLYAQENV